MDVHVGSGRIQPGSNAKSGRCLTSGAAADAVLRSRPRPDAGSSHLRNVKRSYKPALFSSLLNRFCNTIIPTLKPRDLNREERVVFQSTDLGELHALYESRGLNPSNIKKGLDGNPSFRVVSPEGNNLDFLQYAEGSEQAKARGQFLSPDRISTHLWHAGVMTKDTATSGRFYREKLGFTNLRFGTRGEYLETPGRDSNTETKPPLADSPATHDKYESEQWGAVNHLAIEVTDMHATRDLLQKRGGFDDLRVRAHVGNNRHWLMFLFDPAGTRTEIMETAVQEELPAMTVMTPGGVAPIRPKTPGVLPWP